jgi:protease I
MLETIKSLLRNEDSSPIINEAGELWGRKAAILATDGFEQSELFLPKAALEGAGCRTYIVSLKKGRIKGWSGGNWGKSIPVDLTVYEAQSMKFDFLLLPGGVLNPDKLRDDPSAVAFVRSFVNQNKPIAAICHGVQTLIETGMVNGRTLTSWPSLSTDLINAGANWIDKEVVRDEKLITSRKPADIPIFNREMIQTFINERLHEGIPNTESFISIR